MRCLRIAIMIMLLSGVSQHAEALERGSLAARLDSVLRAPPLERARVSALVVRDSDGEVLYAHDPDRALIPASNMKVLTAIAALDAFGPAHRFVTRILTNPAPDAAGSVGDLFVVGGGDPVLNSEDWWQLAGELRRMGISRVTGNLIVDDSVLDAQRWHPSWGKTSSRAYHAPVGGLTANYGSFSVTVVPGAVAGAPVRAVVDPPVPYLRVSNRARTGASDSRNTLAVDRRAGESRELVTLEGVVPAGSKPQVLYRSVLDPSAYAGSVFRWQLAANGIEVEGKVLRGRAAKDAVELLAFEGRSMAEIVRLFVKYSNNAVAETLVKSIGLKDRGEGSWSAGVPAFQERLTQLGLAEDGLVIVDGSGLSYSNKVSARTLVSALRLAHRSFRLGPELRVALPLAGRDGTLRRRAGKARGRIRAKTGLLTQVTGLSGYAQLADGSAATFSILVNGYRGRDEEAMGAVDRFVEELVRASPRQLRRRKFGPKGP